MGRDRAGGSVGKLRSLFVLLRRFHEQLEFDWDVRGWDLLDFWRGEITYRKAWVRIRNLPVDSAFQRAFDPDDTRWGETEHLLARLIDVTYVGLGSKTRVYRPGSPEEKAAIADARRVQAIRDRNIAKHRKAKTRGGGRQ